MKRRDEMMKTQKKAFTRLTVLLLLFMAAAAMAPTASADPGWDSYRVIEIDNGKVSGDADLSSFPVLINHTADWLQRADSEDHVRRADGYDIVFTNADNSSLLDFEIEEYDGTYNATHGRLVAWVRIPTLDYNDNTTIRLWYGNSVASDWSNPTGVWDTNYKGVWHLEETTGGANAIKDSTSNDNDGTDHGSPNLDATGKIDGADDFDGSDDCVQISNFDPPHQGTVSLWVKRGSIGTRQRILGGHDAYEILFTSDNKISNQLFAAETDVLKGSTITSTTDWYYLAFTYDNTSNASAIFLNGNSDVSGSTANG
jgi:hypothetical protein